MLNMPVGWTREDLAVWRTLERRFPGIGTDMERLILKMATSEGLGAKTRIQYEETSQGFVARIEAFSDLLFGSEYVAFPVIPDEFNPEGKSINPGMAPHPFASLSDCRKAAEDAEIEVMLKSLRQEEAKFVAEFKSKSPPCKKTEKGRARK